MKVVKNIRNVLQFIAIILFVYQTCQALVKYFDSPTVIIKTETTLDDIVKPRSFHNEISKICLLVMCISFLQSNKMSASLSVCAFVCFL